MATLNGHLTKLEAVNDMLLSIGEREVSSLASGLPDAELAENILDRVSREVQLIGWHVNTLRGFKITKNVDNQFVVGVNTLKVDTVNPRELRKESSPPHTGHIDVVMKRSSDNTKWLLADVANNSETWTSETELTVDMVQFLEFEHLTPALQVYIAKKAGRQFQKGVMGSRVLWEFTEQDVRDAEAEALQEDTENADDNMIFGNPHTFSAVFRNNPHYGR